MRATLRHLLFSDTPFSPRSLFLSGEVGAWYDYRDLSTLYQTSTGTTAVTAGEQPVGLVLDKSKGLVLGPELVTNGGFDSTATGWTPGDAASGLSVVDGRLRVTNGDATAAWAYTSITTVSGKTYRFSIDFLAGTSTQYSIGIGTTPSGAQNFAATGVTVNRSGYFTATAATTYFYAQLGNSTNGVYADFDNISVRELPGAHALQSSSTVRPTYRTAPDRLYFDADPDSLTITFPSAPGDCTVAMGNSGGDPVLAYPVNIPTTSFTLDPASVQTAGTELVTNGGFGTGDLTGFTNASTGTGSIVVSGGAVVLSGTDSSNRAVLRWSVATEIGKTYRVSMSAASVVGNNYFRAGPTVGTAFLLNEVVSAGSFVKTFTATTTTTYLEQQTSGSTGSWTITLDNISVRELSAPVGLGTFGPELVTNGGFDSDTTWTKGTGWSISGNVGVGSSVNGNIAQDIAVTVGKIYKVSGTVVSLTAGTVRLLADNTNIPLTTVSAPTTITYYVTAASSTITVGFRSITGFSGTVDSVSVREFIGSAAQNTGLVIVNRQLTAPETAKLTAYLRSRS